MFIGIIGLKGSGKTTVATYLTGKYQFTNKSFADPLKKACKELFLFDDDQLNGTLEQKETSDPRWFGCSPRKAMQYVGTELLRDQLDLIMPGLGKNMFTHHFRLWFHDNQGINIVLSDVRFQNELDMIHELGGIVIKIQRDKMVSFDPHSSEEGQKSITNYDYLICNDSTLDDLFVCVDRIIDEHYNKSHWHVPL